MKTLLLLMVLLGCANAYSSEDCPYEKIFREHGWVVHCEDDFDQIVKEKLAEFIPEIGKDLIFDDSESYISDFSHDYYMIMWIVIWDRISTTKDEMWGDVAVSKTCPHTGEYTELRWYDPETKKKHIVFNPKHARCLTTKIPLAYNTIF